MSVNHIVTGRKNPTFSVAFHYAGLKIKILLCIFSKNAYPVANGVAYFIPTRRKTLCRDRGRKKTTFSATFRYAGLKIKILLCIFLKNAYPFASGDACFYPDVAKDAAPGIGEDVKSRGLSDYTFDFTLNS
ncbi:MAG: hypothetical protein FWF54_00235 [Candidatus Azobacteroides sp.]|nr:hypothetical protein [Candidatus Azobacteroides sp.]